METKHTDHSIKGLILKRERTSISFQKGDAIMPLILARVSYGIAEEDLFNIDTNTCKIRGLLS
ncbi:MAG: hypothetical protein PHV74_11975 [Dehalococcoidia bacterium]|nr:hypothetical protein [Dehalococcoidia bacterium]